MANMSDAWGNITVSHNLMKHYKKEIETIFKQIDFQADYTIGIEEADLHEIINDTLPSDQKDGYDTEFNFGGFGRWAYENNLSWLVKPDDHCSEELKNAQNKVANAMALDPEKNYITAEYDEVEIGDLISNHTKAQIWVQDNPGYDENGDYSDFDIDVEILSDEYDRNIAVDYFEGDDFFDLSAYPENETNQK